MSEHKPLDLNHVQKTYLATFLKPRPIHNTPVLKPEQWDMVLGESHTAFAQRLIETKLLIRAGLVEHLIDLFTVAELEAILEAKHFPINGRKFDLAFRAMQIDYAGMWEAVKAKDLELYECSGVGTRFAIEQLQGEPPECLSLFID